MYMAGNVLLRHSEESGLQSDDESGYWPLDA
jgi:hypothetical protein